MTVNFGFIALAIRFNLIALACVVRYPLSWCFLLISEKQDRLHFSIT